AMLALFGAPYLERILGAYQEEWPLADGWRERVPLHQLHPLLVHVVLFGGVYHGGLMDAVARVRALSEFSRRMTSSGRRPFVHTRLPPSRPGAPEMSVPRPPASSTMTVSAAMSHGDSSGSADRSTDPS